MKITYKNLITFITLIIFSIILVSCGKKYTPEQKAYINKIEKERREKDNDMQNSPDSPFNHDTNAHFEPLKYYPVDPAFIFHSKLYEYAQKDTIQIFGTKGEERKAVKFGYVKINYEGKAYRLNVYEGSTKNGTKYYSIWFTDLTTGNETYGVGRYLNFDLKSSKDYVYTIDFNLAYNPYCAYSSKYSCAIPTKEDHIDLSVTAGEKKFHQ